MLRKGPIKLSFNGPAYLWHKGGNPQQDVHVLFNQEGNAKPIVPAFPQLVASAAQPAPPTLSPLGAAPDPTTPQKGTWPPCVVAGQFIFCMDLNGSIRRTGLNGEGEKPIAVGRRGSTMAAVAFGEHTVLAFLGDRITTEGATTLAFMVLDDGVAMPLSEDGSGATFVTLAAQKDHVLALYIDARTALTPVHARTLTLADDKLVLGKDAVIFVGDGSSGRLTAALATGTSGPAFALVPMAKGSSEFGMAAIRLDDQLKDDLPAVWSLYPNGLSPAPIAATQGLGTVHVARVRPMTKDADSRRVIELGRLHPDGTFNAGGEVVEGPSFTHITMVADHTGYLWLSYTNSEGTWVEQRGPKAGR